MTAQPGPLDFVAAHMLDNPLRVELTAVHWHLIPGGIEFEAADGFHVHVQIPDDLYRSLGVRMAEMDWQPRKPGER